MNDSEYIDKLVKSLETVPPKKLLIIDLANRYVKDGQLDYEALAGIVPQVNLAITEAKTYGAFTIRAVDALIRLLPEVEDVGP